MCCMNSLSRNGSLYSTSMFPKCGTHISRGMQNDFRAYMAQSQVNAVVKCETSSSAVAERPYELGNFKRVGHFKATF